MKLDKQITLLLQDPAVYYTYYHNQCNNVSMLLSHMKGIGCTLEQLIDVRVALAESRGRRAIARGALASLPKNVLIEYWKTLTLQKEYIHGDLDKLRKYEEFVWAIEDKCQAEMQLSY